ncbi:MAG: peptidoglycan-binding protein [Alphaproteobacteria bacterium]|nr:peptidoglycan-binding protein [Alphaproteobacteria bacterium]
MRTSWMAPLGAGVAVTVMITGCSWVGGGERTTASVHKAPVTTDPQAGTITPTTAAAGTSADGRGVSGPTNDQVREAQQKLKDLGLYQGRIDGIYGPQTIAAVDKFQSENGLPRTRALNDATQQRLQTAQQPAPDTQSGNPQTSAVPPNQNTGTRPDTNPSSAPNSQPAH